MVYVAVLILLAIVVVVRGLFLYGKSRSKGEYVVYRKWLWGKNEEEEDFGMCFGFNYEVFNTGEDEENNFHILTIGSILFTWKYIFKIDK